MFLFASILTRIFALPVLYQVLWLALALLTIALIVLMRTEWGRERPTHRYVVLSLVAHLALICLATTVRFMSAPQGQEAAAPIRVRIAMRTPSAPEPTPIAEPEPQQVIETQPENSTEPVLEPLEAPALDPVPKPAPTIPQPITDSEIEQQQPIEQAAAEPTPDQHAKQPADVPPVSNSQAPLQQLVSQPHEIVPAEQPAAEPPAESSTTQSWQPAQLEPVIAELPPTPYTARNQADRVKVVEQEGGSRVTEDAVASALDWLAAAQSQDGRWDSSRWSGGREQLVLGHNRRGAGTNADTGITGLALLALLGAGNTHQEGPYAESVRLGLEYLLRTQQPDGSLVGEAAFYAQTYCHSMATFALAEAMASTEDERLAQGVSRGVHFLLDRQHRSDGGWRYKRGDPGDMSQMGWVIMALRSAELGGIEIPPTVWTNIERFVRSVRRGNAGGLACYQPTGPVSRTMTAESMYCRQILGWPTAASPSSEEAVSHLQGRLPGAGKPNLYYWYYATLALHHHRHASRQAESAWQTWNDALTRSLTQTQVSEGPNRGSWNPNCVWGGYGGRVYSTALACMCLEVYYRYNPDEVTRDPWLAARPGSRHLR